MFYSSPASVDTHRSAYFIGIANYFLIGISVHYSRECFEEFLLFLLFSKPYSLIEFVCFLTHQLWNILKESPLVISVSSIVLYSRWRNWFIALSVRLTIWKAKRGLSLILIFEAKVLIYLLMLWLASFMGILVDDIVTCSNGTRLGIGDVLCFRRTV